MPDRLKRVMKEAAQEASSVETGPESGVSRTGQADVVFVPPPAVVDPPIFNLSQVW